MWIVRFGGLFPIDRDRVSSRFTITPELEDLVLERMSEGESLRSICADPAVPVSEGAFRKRTLSHPEFAARYLIAQQLQMHAWAEDILAIADDDKRDFSLENGQLLVNGEHINRSRLRLDARKWLMARICHKQWGDKVSQEHSGPAGGAVPVTLNVVFKAPGG